MENVLFGVRYQAIRFSNSTACALRKVVSDHVNVANDANCVDIYIDGNSVAGGGIFLDEVISQAPAGHGIVIKNFLQLWGRMVNTDNCGKNGLEIYNCAQIHLFHCYEALSGQAADAFLCKIWSSTKATYHYVSMTDCTFSGAQRNGNALHIEEISEVSLENSQVMMNTGTGIYIKNCEDINITGNDILQNNKGIELYTSYHCIVNSNIVRANTTQGIVESGTSDYNIITGNVARLNGSTGIVKIGVNSIEANNIK
jgi:parallel beta-helix repeat protein